MLSSAYIEEMMSQSMYSPLTLADRLGLRPSEGQVEMLEKLHEQPKLFDIQGDTAHTIIRAASLFALWRLLAYRGSKGTVIASTPELGGQFIGFLHRMTTQIDPALSSVAHWRRWNEVQLGSDAGHELRLVPNRPVCAAGRGCSTHTVISIGAGSNDLDFLKTQEVLFGHSCPEGEVRIRIW